jgi:hypothetical protein
VSPVKWKNDLKLVVLGKRENTEAFISWLEENYGGLVVSTGGQEDEHDRTTWHSYAILKELV